MKQHDPRVAAATRATTASGRPLRSPEVHDDGRITFRFEAAAAREVVLRCEGLASDLPMARDEAGVWSVTSPVLEPDILVYSFVVDGLRVIDPANPFIKYNLLTIESQVHVPGPASLPWEINDVPRGRLHRHFFHSDVADDDRDLWVYTPPGYEADPARRHPVLYLLHGYSDDASAWTTIGRAHVILDNLIARGEAQPMVVAMPLGYGTMDVIRAGWPGLRQGDVWRRNIALFRAALRKEVLPRVEQACRVFTDREHTAIAGLSMGGTEALDLGLNDPDRFGWIGAFSSGGLDLDFQQAYPQFGTRSGARPRLLWISCGEEDGLLEDNRRLHEWLSDRQVEHRWVVTPGTHSFRVWRRNLAALAPLLFRPAP